MHARLAAVDPRAARRIHPNDAQRIQRALEVFEVSGRRLSEWHLASPRASGPAGPVVRLAVAPADRADLHRAIDARFRTMVARGLVDEVRSLRERSGVGPELPSMRAVGYRQVWDHLQGRTNHAEMVERAIAATRQLARRQLTWLRSLSGVRWLEPAAGAEALDSILCNAGDEPREFPNRLQ